MSWVEGEAFVVGKGNSKRTGLYYLNGETLSAGILTAWARVVSRQLENIISTLSACPVAIR